MKHKSGKQLHIFSDSYLKQISGHAMLSALSRPVWETILPKKQHSGKKNSSRKSDTEYDYLVYQLRGYPSSEQAGILNQNIGACRWMWNRMVAERIGVYDSTGKDTLRPRPAFYKPDEPWLGICDSYALCNVQLNVESTFSNWHSGLCGKPNFKKKHVCRDSYTTNKNNRSENISLSHGRLVLPKIPGSIRVTCHRKIKSGGILKSVTVSHEPDGRWLFAVKYAYPKKQKPSLLDRLDENTFTRLRHIGLDMSLPELYIDSNGNRPSYQLDGSIVVFQKQYRKLECRIAHEQHVLSRKVRGSRNYNKQLIRIARLHAKAKHVRCDFLRQMAVRLARNYDVISIEDLDIRALKQALRFGKSVSDNAWGTFIRYLEEACRKTGSLVIRTDKWFPSSKTCSHCGYIKHDLKLNERTYICPKCGYVMDRDFQAAVNIDREGLNIIRNWQHPVRMKPASAA